MIKLRDGVVFTKMEEESILTDVDGARYIALNRSATAMLEILMESPTREEALTLLLDKFDADRGALENGIETLLKDLRKVDVLPPLT